MTIVLIVLAVIVVAAVGFGVSLAVSGKRKYTAANEIVPGTTSRAPASWAGAHSPEAKLHRRLGDAVRAIQANSAMTDASLLSARATIEQMAMAIDDRLIASAALPAAHRDDAIARVAPAVDALEESVASLTVAAGSSASQQALDAAVLEVQSRLALLAEARAEIDRLDPVTAADVVPSTILPSAILAADEAPNPSTEPGQSGMPGPGTPNPG